MEVHLSIIEIKISFPLILCSVEMICMIGCAIVVGGHGRRKGFFDP